MALDKEAETTECIFKFVPWQSARMGSGGGEGEWTNKVNPKILIMEGC